MSSLIANFIEMQKCNWKNPLKLMMAAMVAVRIIELNDDDDVITQTIGLLRKLRDIAIDWIEKVQMAMNETQNQNDLTKLRKTLVEISIAGAITFSVHFQHEYFDQIFIGSAATTKTAAQLWMEFLVTINNNVLLNESAQSESSPQSFLRMVRQIGVGVQAKIFESFHNNQPDLFEFIKNHWHKSVDGEFKLMGKQTSKQLFVVQVSINGLVSIVQADIVTGKFAVNNLPGNHYLLHLN